mgnify:CR=1 FL=1
MTLFNPMRSVLMHLLLQSFFDDDAVHFATGFNSCAGLGQPELVVLRHVFAAADSSGATSPCRENTWLVRWECG